MELLSRCPEKFHCPVLLETLIKTHILCAKRFLVVKSSDGTSYNTHLILPSQIKSTNLKKFFKFEGAKSGHCHGQFRTLGGLLFHCGKVPIHILRKHLKGGGGLENVPFCLFSVIYLNASNWLPLERSVYLILTRGRGPDYTPLKDLKAFLWLCTKYFEVKVNTLNHFKS